MKEHEQGPLHAFVESLANLDRSARTPEMATRHDLILDEMRRLADEAEPESQDPALKEITVWEDEEGEIIGFENVPEGYRIRVRGDYEYSGDGSPGPTFVEYDRHAPS